MKIEIIKNKFFDLESVLKGERKNIYNKDAYAFLECKDDKDNIARFFDLGEIALNYNQENNQIEVYFLKYEFFQESYEILKYHIVNSIKFAFVSAEDTFKRLSNLKINVKDFIKE
ncbi:hypothetical protein ACMTLJ_001645 [Campylobacter jejuni]|nr:hypothetical protein [Campylobacter jejuni]HEG1318214.1 hypothetical protein [Campylobacter jejuni]HEG2923179.1 hypothetical protein [Campylobacter jejuni]